MAEQINQQVTIIGETNFRNQRTKFGIKTDDRRRHMYLVGKTGVGKSTVLKTMIIQDILAGNGVAVVDPHGDLVESLLDFIPRNRINDVVYFDPADFDYPIAFNVLEVPDPRYKYIIASGLVGVFHKIWIDSWGPRLEYILRNCILALLDYPSSTLLGIMRILVDKDYRKRVISMVQDPVVKSFWIDEYAVYNEKFRSEAISPIQNKVGQFLTSSIIRNIVGQPKSTIDMQKIMDEKKILLMNLAKGKVGEDNSALLGAMIITKLQLAAMSRANIPEEQRQDFYLYVDEFQNFATESFANILSEARKYRLNLIMAHQYIAQLIEPVLDAVMGNVGTIVCFRIGAADAEILEKEFLPVFDQNDLVNLDKYQAYVKLMIDGITSRPFSMVTVPPYFKKTHEREKIIKVSRERYANKRESVEKKIAYWSGMEFHKQMAEEENIEQRRKEKGISEIIKKTPPPPKIKKEEVVPMREKPGMIKNLAEVLKTEKKSKKLYRIRCGRCKKNIKISFRPEEGKLVYCDQCKKIKESKKRKILERRITPPPLVFSTKKNNYQNKEESPSPKELKPGRTVQLL